MEIDDTRNVILGLFLLALIVLCVGFVFIEEDSSKKEVCELKGMKISLTSDYCINGSNAYKIIQVDGKYKIIKEVVTLE